MNAKKISEELIEQTTQFHGHWCPGLAIGIRAAEWALGEMGQGHDGRIVAVAETDLCAVDAIQYLTGCTSGKGNLIVKEYGKNAFTFYRKQDDKAARLVARPDIYGESRVAMGTLHRKMLAQGLSQEEQKSWQEIRAAVCNCIMTSALPELFDIKDPVNPVPEITRILDPQVCDACGETVMEAASFYFAGRRLCIPCFEAGEER
jgi:formylmethanofuran dehydrogenase subunit E